VAQFGSKINRHQHYDANSDKGYGRLEPKFHTLRSFNQYPEPPERNLKADSEIDDETYTSVIKKLLAYTPMDPYAKKGTDPFHFVDGRSKIAELSTAKGMVPFPNMYKSKQAVVGGTAAKYPTGPTVGFQSRARPTGTKKGFSSAPYPKRHEDLYGQPETFEEIINTDLDEKHVDLIKKMVDLIHLEQDIR